MHIKDITLKKIIQFEIEFSKSKNKAEIILFLSSILILLTSISVITEMGFANGLTPSVDVPGKKNLSEQLIFHAWGTETKLDLQKINNSALRIQGSTGKTSSGFTSQNLDYEGKYITLNIGNLVKSPLASHISFSFDVKGLFKDYRLIYTNGPIAAGWVNNTYYQDIGPHSSTFINLPVAISNVNGMYLLLKRVTIVIDGQTTVTPLEFSIESKTN